MGDCALPAQGVMPAVPASHVAGGAHHAAAAPSLTPLPLLPSIHTQLLEVLLTPEKNSAALPVCKQQAGLWLCQLCGKDDDTRQEAMKAGCLEVGGCMHAWRTAAEGGHSLA